MEWVKKIIDARLTYWGRDKMVIILSSNIQIWYESCFILFQISLKFIPRSSINNKPNFDYLWNLTVAQLQKKHIYISTFP